MFAFCDNLSKHLRVCILCFLFQSLCVFAFCFRRTETLRACILFMFSRDLECLHSVFVCPRRFGHAHNLCLCVRAVARMLIICGCVCEPLRECS